MDQELQNNSLRILSERLSICDKTTKTLVTINQDRISAFSVRGHPIGENGLAHFGLSLANSDLTPWRKGDGSRVKTLGLLTLKQILDTINILSTYAWMTRAVWRI